MKIMTVLGTRPEIIRLSRVIPLLDRYAESHTLVHTGQNFDPQLSDIFFEELGLRSPDVHLGVGATSFGDQLGKILVGIENAMRAARPDRVLILGDTNSGLSALVAQRLGIPVYHMEAGNRCYDNRVPEETNRRVIDHSSDVLLPYTERSRENLLAEGIAGNRIFVTGNPINEVMTHYEAQIASSSILDDIGVEDRGYFLVTLHRAENVDDAGRLSCFVQALEKISSDYSIPAIVSAHPRMRARLREFGLTATSGDVRFIEPFGFFDFVHLEMKALCVLSDSGTVQEEACILGRPNVTLRDVTERPETVECGSNFLSGADSTRIIQLVRYCIEQDARWVAPKEYLEASVSNTVARLLLSYRLAGGGHR